MNNGNHKNIVAANHGERTIFERVRKENATGGHTWRSEARGREAYTWRADVNMTDLEDMAHRAACSKGGKCRDGALTVTIISRRPL